LKILVVKSRDFRLYQKKYPSRTQCCLLCCASKERHQRPHCDITGFAYT